MPKSDRYCSFHIQSFHKQVDLGCSVLFRLFGGAQRLYDVQTEEGPRLLQPSL